MPTCYGPRMSDNLRDYLREIDLNPPLGGPVIDPHDPRAMHYFGFLSEGQEIVMVQPTGQPRIFISWHYSNNPVATPPPQPLPPVDAILDFSSGPPVVRYEEHHQRAHVFVWLDPTAAPAGTSKVRVRAWK